MRRADRLFQIVQLLRGRRVVTAAELADELATRLSDDGQLCTVLTLTAKVRRMGAPVEPNKYMGHGACDNFSRTVKLAAPTASTGELVGPCRRMLEEVLKQEVLEGRLLDVLLRMV